jgi:hypothetical protein
MAELLGFFDYEVNGGRKAAPLGGFSFELDAASGGEGIELGLAASLGFGPFGFDPGFAFEAIEGGVEGALLDLEYFARDLLDAFGDGPAMFGFEGDGFEDKEIERALDEIVWFTHTMTIYRSDCR